ncbi:MAG: flagellar hook-basal body complex protein FliE [Planctomycetales bacterium]|nr:flagellar hook-basal body complex protein FliE [Planctomycetales bacterium]
MTVSRIDGIANTLLRQANSSPHSSGDKSNSFSEIITQQLRKIDFQQQEADAAIGNLVMGKSDNVQDVVLSVAQADLAFRLALEIRNRLVESYQEIMRMQV